MVGLAPPTTAIESPLEAVCYRASHRLSGMVTAAHAGFPPRFAIACANPFGIGPPCTDRPFDDGKHHPWTTARLPPCSIILSLAGDCDLSCYTNPALTWRSNSNLGFHRIGPHGPCRFRRCNRCTRYDRHISPSVVAGLKDRSHRAENVGFSYPVAIIFRAMRIFPTRRVSRVTDKKGN